MAVLAAFMVMINVGLVYAEVTCEAPAVNVGHPADIICHFDVDISVAKKNIKVQRRPLTSAGFDPDKVDTVLDCYWQNAADFSCQFGNGFKLIGESGKSAVVRIPSASKNDEQIYMCEVVPSEPSNIRSCTLTVKDTSAGNYSYFRPERLEGETAEIKGIVTAMIIILCAFIISAILVVLLFLFRKRLKKIPLTCWPQTSFPVKSQDPKDVEDQSAHPMISKNSIVHNDIENVDEDDLRDKEEIDRCVRYLLRLKESGKLIGVYRENETNETVTTLTQFAGPSASSDKSMPTSHLKESVGHVVARTADTKITPADYHMSDIKRLQLTVSQWYEREIAELTRKKEEIEAEENIKAMKTELENHRAWRKSRDIDKKKPESKQSQKQKDKRRHEEEVKIEKEAEAVRYLSDLRRGHEEARQRQKDEDQIRLHLLEQKQQHGDLGQEMKEKNKSEESEINIKATMSVVSQESPSD